MIQYTLDNIRWVSDTLVVGGGGRGGGVRGEERKRGKEGRRGLCLGKPHGNTAIPSLDSTVLHHTACTISQCVHMYADQLYCMLNNSNGHHIVISAHTRSYIQQPKVTT